MAILKPQSSAHRHVRSVSLRTTLFFETFALMMLTIICIAVATFFLALHELNIRIDSQLQTIAQNKAAILESTVIRQREQLATLGQDPDLRALNSLTELVGFEELIRISDDGTMRIIAGTHTDELTDDLLHSLTNVDATVFRPLLGENGWKRYVISTPQRQGGIRTGTLIAVFDAENLINRLLHADEAGKTAEVLVGAHIEGGNIVLRYDERSKSAVPLLDENGGLTAIEEAIQNNEGVIETTDYAGIPVLAASRTVSTLGWTVVAKIDKYEATAPVLRLAFRIGGIGLMIVALLSLSTFFLTRRIIGPLEELVRKLDGLEVRHWNFNRTITTGDEIETVDIAATDLTNRLRTAHEHLEDIVRNRTEQLRHEHARDQAILQSMDDGLVVTDDQGIVTYMNHLAVILTGIEDGVGKPVTSVLPIVTKEGIIMTSDDHPVPAVLKTKSRYAPANDPQYAMQRRDGTKTALQLRATPILRGQKCDGVIAVIRDVSEERRIDRMKSEFISLVSHQLRTPLTSMRWYLEMLITEGENSLNQDQKDWIAEASSSNARMVHLVNALLNVSRIELGKFQLAPETINIKDLVKGATATLSQEIKKKNITVDIRTDEKNVGVRSDKGLLLLIIENLIGNAIKYSPEKGTVNIQIGLDAKATAATFRIEDHGIGIPAEQQKDIGHRLFRASNAVKTDTDGNGLGLYISQVAAESVGATLTFTSTENKGTTFTLVIPLDPKQPRT